MAATLKADITPNGVNQGDLVAFMQNVRDIVNANKILVNALRNQHLNQVMATPGLVIGTGATTSYRHGATQAYRANGIYGALGAAADHVFTSAHVITMDTWGVFLITLSAGGTWKTSVPAATQAYASEALAIAAMPSPPANEAIIGYITVRARSSVNFTANTTTLTADNGSGNSQTVNYYNGGFAAQLDLTAVSQAALKLTAG